nr:rna cytidine acetyltransferase [Quercus suber]
MCPSTLIYDYPLSQENPGILVLHQAQLISASGVLLHLDKTLKSTVTSLAARGHGKSAALGLAIAGAIAAG